MSLLLPKSYVDQVEAELMSKRIEANQEPREFEIYRSCDVWRFLNLIQDSDAKLVSVHHEQELLTGNWIIRYFHDQELSMEVHT